jgi:hypothetical protein
MTVDDVTGIAAERHEVGRVKLKRGLKVERLNVMHLKGVSLSTRFASGVNLQVCGTNARPLRGARNATGCGQPRISR